MAETNAAESAASNRPAEKTPEDTGATKEPVITFRHTDCPKELEQTVVSVYKQHRSLASLPAICEAMKKSLDEKEPKGWVVFAGMHLVGACSFIKGTMAEFEVNSTAFVVFKTFCPA